MTDEQKSTLVEIVRDTDDLEMAEALGEFLAMSDVVDALFESEQP